MPQSADEIKVEQPSLFLFLGPADCGKSYAATSWGLKTKKYGGDDDRPAYVIEMDGRLMALRGRPVQFDSYTNKEGAIGVINRLDELVETTLKNNEAPFHTLIIDSFTAFNELALADSLNVTIESNDNSEKTKGRKRGELQMMTPQDYGYEAEAVRRLLWEALTDLKKYCNVIVTAHEVEKYKVIKEAGNMITRTELDGLKILARDKIAAKIITKFDEVYHFGAKEVVVSYKKLRRSVTFQDCLARTSHPKLIALGTVAQDISDKEFYKWWKEKIS